MSRTPGPKVIVLDRDGTIVVDRDYLADPDGLEFLPGAPEGLRHLQQLGYRLVVITNQSGVGRGLLSLDTMHAINQRLMQMARTVGVEIAAIYSCPHRPDEHCECRKPQPMLLLDAARELHFVPQSAIVIGDKLSDVQLGRAVGARTLLIASAPAAQPVTADHVVADLREAAALIERLESSAAQRSSSPVPISD